MPPIVRTAGRGDRHGSGKPAADSLPAMSEPPYQPGWYPDPMQRFEFRFHNGTVWTGDVSTNGVRYVDPLGIDPGPWSRMDLLPCTPDRGSPSPR